MPKAETTGTARGATLDPAYLKDIDAISATLLEEVAQRFAGDASDRMVGIRTAAGLGDPKVVAREAHSLKGSAAVVGALGLAGLCGVMEERAIEGALPSAGELGAAERELEDVLAAVAHLAAALHRLR